MNEHIKESWGEWEEVEGIRREEQAVINVCDPLQVVVVKHGHKLRYKQRLALAWLIKTMTCDETTS